MTTIVRLKLDVYVNPTGLTLEPDGDLLYPAGHEKVLSQALRDRLDQYGFEYDVLLEAPEDEFGEKFKQVLIRGGR